MTETEKKLSLTSIITDIELVELYIERTELGYPSERSQEFLDGVAAMDKVMFSKLLRDLKFVKEALLK